jgi:cold shock protein
MRTGTLKWFDATKGYGFIVPTDGGEDVFVRGAALHEAGISNPPEGMALSFSVERTTEGLQATQITEGR